MTTCFTNPGTSEMHFVAPLDSGPEMPAVLASFEGVATGAAVGHALHRASHNLAPASHDLARLAPNLLADRFGRRAERRRRRASARAPALLESDEAVTQTIAGLTVLCVCDKMPILR